MANNITVTPASSVVFEGDTVQLQFRRYGDLSQDETLYVTTVEGGSADYTDAYRTVRTPVFFRAGSAFETFSFQTYRDSVLEAPESVRIRIESPTNVLNGGEQIQELSVVLEDTTPKPVEPPTYNLTLSAVKGFAYEGEDLIYRAKLDTTEHNGVAFRPGFQFPGLQIGRDDLANKYNSNFGFSQNDYIRFAPGQDTVDITLKTVRDGIFESEEVAVIVPGEALSSDYTKYKLNFTGEARLILRDSDAVPAPVVTPAPEKTAPTVIINGNNNVVNINSNNTTNIYVNSFNGTTGRDTLTGTAKADKIDGKAGNDLLIGNAGNDSIIGGAGNDTMYGGTGKNVIDAGAGRDRLFIDTEGKADLADTLRNLDRTDRIFFEETSKLSFSKVTQGIGIFADGALEAIVTGNFTIDAVTKMTAIL